MVAMDLPMIALSILRWQNVSVNVITIENSFQSGDKVAADIKKVKNYFYVDRSMESFNGNRICSFCNTAIDNDGSICDKCMIIYNIKTSDTLNDGCGCDT
ncbi:MAG: hypothetical protein M3156_02010 [Thermoproteota archaeon]|jgi:hypothetical protein|nr:hypothetical protein [Thermoproteota archaeon]